MAKDKSPLNILVDTCIWIDYTKSEIHREVINTIIKDNILFINDFINFEIEIGLRKISDKMVWNSKSYDLINLPVSPDVVNEMVAYKDKLKKYKYQVTPSAIDGIIGAQILKYKKSNLFLLTANHKDFPVDFFDRIETFWVNAEKPYTYCLYKAK
jgi:predicted nucleic acid-binding protein